ncbi:DUF2946 family protein [Roseateles sp. BYS87W]|uniref:DUF2946 family protein n=1 Tax=Pelomonas baiyunensis TaxID=3299026 RepID=A0ABW7H1D1_9BURK
MDDIVKAALKKWPNVPACFDWLALDARGDWYMRDERIQRAGPFPQVKGSRVEHDKLIAFIGRNYACDDAGQWYFQNGPQRVYVTLECTPWVWRLQPDGRVLSHTGALAQVQGSALDEAGRLYLFTDLGPGLVHTADMALAADAVEHGHWTPEDVAAADLPARFQFVRQPAPAQAG